MAITYRSASNAAGQASGSVAASTVSITPTLPTGATSGDRIFITEMASAATMTTPSGWFAVISNQQVGSGAVANTSGARYVSIYLRDYDGVWSMPALALTSAANLSHWVGAIAITPTSGSVFGQVAVSDVGQSYNTATTAYTDTSNSSFTTYSNGFLIAASCFRGNVTSSACSITQTGATFGTVTERCDGGDATGFDIGGKIHTCSVTTGASATITQTQTVNATSQGETFFVVQNEHIIGSTISPLTLTEDFSGGSINGSLWTAINGGSPVQTGGQLTFPAGGWLQSQALYDLTSGSVYAQFIPAAPTYMDMWLGASINDPDPYNPFIRIHIDNSTNIVSANTRGSANTFGPTHVAGRYYRIRQSSGNVLYDWSDNPAFGWTNFASHTPLLQIKALALILAGQNGTLDAMDNVNFLPAVAKIDTLVEPFNNLTTNGWLQTGSTDWYYSGAASWGTCTTSSGIVTIPAPNNGAPLMSYINTPVVYTLNESSVIIKVAALPIENSGQCISSFTFGDPGPNSGIGCYITGGSIFSTNSGASTAFSVGTNPWVKISMTGTTVTYSTSNNGTSWTSFGTSTATTVNNTFTIAALTTTTGGLSVGGSLQVDLVNFSGLNSADFFKMLM